MCILLHSQFILHSKHRHLFHTWATLLLVRVAHVWNKCLWFRIKIQQSPRYKKAEVFVKCRKSVQYFAFKICVVYDYTNLNPIQRHKYMYTKAKSILINTNYKLLKTSREHSHSNNEHACVYMYTCTCTLSLARPSPTSHFPIKCCVYIYMYIFYIQKH